MVIKDKLEMASTLAISWLKNNFMKANASKFQAICLSRENFSIDFEIDNQKIQSESVVKLLGINIDNKLILTAMYQLSAERQQNKLMHSKDYANTLITQVNSENMNHLSRLILSIVQLYEILSQ